MKGQLENSAFDGRTKVTI